jgi:hypothetical protein
VSLQWKDQGNGSFYARDEATGLSAQVEQSGISPEKPFVWFIADLPILPPPSDGYLTTGDDYPNHNGCAATAEEARTAAEDAMPDRDKFDAMRVDAENKWKGWDKARRDAAPNN